jgi:hypothetical protein
MLHNKNLLAGFLFVCLGAGFLLTASGYAFGRLTDMGPGFFPKLLSSVLIIFGAVLMFRGLRTQGERFAWGIKPLLWVTLAIVSFGFLLSRFGLLPAIAALVFLSGLASRDTKIKEFPYVFGFLTILSVVVFVWGLKAPYPLISLGQ